MEKKWVFEELVESDRDFVGLIAYALYKDQKHRLAVSLREQGKTEDEIADKVQTFHDSVIHSGHLSDYTDRSTKLVEGLVEEVEKELVKNFDAGLAQFKAEYDKKKNKEIAAYKNEIDVIKKAHEKELKGKERSIVNKVVKFQVSEKGVFEKLWLWVLSGVPSAVATIVITAIVYAGALALVSDEQRQKVFAEVLYKMVGQNQDSIKK